MKIALDAGHGLYTAGKRCLKSLDPKETREWVLNNGVMSKLEKLLLEYEGIEVLRVDDPMGKVDVSLQDRVKKANSWKADLYISDHKNAGINGGTGGGIVVFKATYASAESIRIQPIFYKHLVNATGLKGNRSNPTPSAQFYVIYKTTMPALLIEGGFMDSRTDVPIILTEAFADKLAQGYVNALVEAYGIKKKAKPIEKEMPLPDGQWFRVVTESFKYRSNAVELQEKLSKAGFKSFLAIHKE